MKLTRERERRLLNLISTARPILAIGLLIRLSACTPPVTSPSPLTSAITHSTIATATVTELPILRQSTPGISEISTTTPAPEPTTDAVFSYDNKITGHPEIDCGHGTVNFQFTTMKGQASSVFVKGQSDKPDCVFHNTRNVTIELAKCNVRRKREINPGGVSYQMTVVVQLHPLFVTKVDKAYNVKCFYREQRTNVNVEFGVSELTTVTVMNDAILPKCTYSVHRDSPNGPMVKFTRVGEQLYHVWDCPSRVYSMLLYNCSAIDGKGSEYPIVDENGCSKDQFLMPQITYTADNTKAMTASSAFNFPDRNTMSFACKIRLCFTSECKSITPPQCQTASPRSNNGSTSPIGAQGITSSIGVISTTTTSSTIGHPENPTNAPSTQPPGLNEDREINVHSTDNITLGGTIPQHELTEAVNKQATVTSVGSSSIHNANAGATTVAGGGPSSTEMYNSRETVSFSSASPTWPSHLDTTPLPADFPRPSDLLQAIQDSSTETNLLDTASKPTAATINEVIHHSVEVSGLVQTTQPPSDLTTARLMLLKGGSTLASVGSLPTHPSQSAATAANAKNSASISSIQVSRSAANRQARDTTGTPEWESHHAPHSAYRRQRSRTVDFDIASPELTIIDDYEEPTSSQLRDVPLKLGDGLRQHSSQHENGVLCFSSTVLIGAGLLGALLFGAILFALCKAWRRSTHNFY